MTYSYVLLYYIQNTKYDILNLHSGYADNAMDNLASVQFPYCLLLLILEQNRAKGISNVQKGFGLYY